MGVIHRAVGREDENGVIVYLGKGGVSYEKYLMVELDEGKVDLGSCAVNTEILVHLNISFEVVHD